jgi:hypothetical protein
MNQQPQSAARLVTCDEHNESRASFVCAHLLLTLEDGVPRGAIWQRDEDGCVNAYCGACDAMLEAGGGAWTAELEARADIKMICEKCFERVLSINETAAR